MLNIHDQMIGRYNARVASTKAGREDLYLADAQGSRTTAGLARVLIGYLAEMKQPRPAEIMAFLHKEFGGQVVASPRSLRVYDDEAAMSVVVARRRTFLPLEAKSVGEAGIVPIIAGVQYQGREGEAWDVVESAEGTILVKREGEDLNAILRDRINRQEIAGGPRFANMRTAAKLSLHPGDVVRFFADGRFDRGEVTSVGQDGGASVKSDRGSFQCSANQIADKIEFGPGTISEMEKENADYFGKFFPSESGDLARDMSGLKPPTLQETIQDIPGEPLKTPEGWRLSSTTPRTAAAAKTSDRDFLSSLLR